MANDDPFLNKTTAPFVEDEGTVGEANVKAGHAAEIDPATSELIKSATEAGTGRGLFVGLAYDPEKDMGDDIGDGERARAYYVPVGGKVQAFLAAGGDLTTAADANVTEDDILKEVNLGALAAVSTDTAATNESGALYMALEDVDNSGAAAGVDNQERIDVVRIA